MNILTQSIKELYGFKDLHSLDFVIDEYLNPLITNMPALNYAELISKISTHLHQYGKQIIKNTLEKMDLEFRNAPSRKRRYYVKQTRNRTIITAFGEVTYKRTEYIDRTNNSSYCYVDRKIKLRSKERYDMSVQSLIVELYSNQNSMIKVGEIIADKINGAYQIEALSNPIPRQTVFNILNRFKTIKLETDSLSETPNTLYVMADEKYLASQNRHKIMVKEAIIFEGKKKISINSKKERYSLTNKYIIASCKGKFWENVHDELNKRYDMSKVSQIYLLGDGASWIKAGCNVLTTSETKVNFALDRFHTLQAINHITKDKNLVNLLSSYMINNMKKDFKKLTDIIIEENINRKDTIQNCSNYILKNWGNIQTMHKRVKIGCGMEQAIYHVLSSVFSNVPKAYSENHIETYLCNRVNHQNNLNLKELFIKAIDSQADKNNNILIKPKINFSIFDSKKHNLTYTLNLNSKNYKEITKF